MNNVTNGATLRMLEFWSRKISTNNKISTANSVSGPSFSNMRDWPMLDRTRRGLKKIYGFKD